MDVYSNIWIAIKWLFGDFFIRILTAPIGILKDALDIYEISWQIVCLGLSLAGVGISLIVKYIKDRV